MVVAVGAVGLAGFLFLRMDDEIRYQFEQGLAQKFPHLNVSVGGARVVEGRGIAIYDLAISETTPSRLQSNLLVVDEIMLVCDAQLSQLVQGVPEIKRVILKHPQLWVAKTATGNWNLESCWPLPPCGDNRPAIEIQNAQLVLSDSSRQALPPLALRDLHLTIPAGRQPRSQPLEIRGAWGGTHVQQATFVVRLNLDDLSWHCTSNFKQLRLSKDLQAWASTLWGGLDDQTVFTGRLDGQLTVEHQFQGVSPPRIQANFQLSEGRVIDPRLPRPLSDLQGTIQCQQNVLQAGISGKCDAANLSLQVERRGLQPHAPLALGMRVTDLPLDKKLYQALPPLLQQEWNKYLPAGTVDADIQLTYDGRTWRPQLTLTGRELAFESHKFRYRVRNGAGTIRYTANAPHQPAVLDVDLVGYGGGQPLRFLGQIFDPRPGALGWLEITGQGLAIEQQMIAALPEKTRRVIESLHPRGHFNLRWRLDRTQPDQQKPHTSLRLELVDSQVNYEKFPYPLSGIQGLVLAEGPDWQFRDLIATGSRNVTCQGTLQRSPVGTELSLQFTGDQLPLDDDLKQALPPAVQQAWEQVRPSGRVDLVASVEHQTGYTQPAIRVSVSPRAETASMQPVFFPYQLEQLSGKFDYFNGELLITDFFGKHGPTTVRSQGKGNFARDGGWQFELTGLSADRLQPRRDLLLALPPPMRKLIEQLQITGKFSLHNTLLKFSQAASNKSSIQASWDAQLDCLQAALHPGIDLQNVHGTIRLVGASDGQSSHSSGELALESLTFEDVQFTNIRGPLWMDETRCLLGSWASERQAESPRRVSAQLYGGSLVSDAWVTLDGVPRYSAVAALTGADLPRMTKECFHSNERLSGKVDATLTLNGYGRSLHTLSGHGEVQVTQAHIYKLPLLVGLLKVLRNATPDSTAFNQIDTKYRIEGRHIYLDQLDFLGDAVSLLGKGETNFDHQLNLVFHGVVGRNEIRLPLVKDFFHQVGQQTLRMYVGGTWSDPQIDTQALPGINHLLQQIQTDLDANTPSLPTTPRKAQRWFPTLPRWSKK